MVHPFMNHRAVQLADRIRAYRMAVPFALHDRPPPALVGQLQIDAAVAAAAAMLDAIPFLAKECGHIGLEGGRVERDHILNCQYGQCFHLLPLPPND